MKQNRNPITLISDNDRARILDNFSKLKLHAALMQLAAFLKKTSPKTYFSLKFLSKCSFVLLEDYTTKLLFRSSHPKVFLRKGALKICSKFTGEHPCRSAISIKLQSIFIKIALRHGCSSVHLLQFSEHLFLRTPLDGCFCLS